MPKRYSAKEVIKILGRYGFRKVSQKGSHIKLKKNGQLVIVPNHRILAAGTLNSILKQANISMNELKK